MTKQPFYLPGLSNENRRITLFAAWWPHYYNNGRFQRYWLVPQGPFDKRPEFPIYIGG